MRLDALAATALAGLALAACGDDPPADPGAEAPGGPAAKEGRPGDGPDAREAAVLRPARCPAEAASGCRTASGTVLYVERVDPDGDGDAHFVLASSESITAPGISVVDVRRSLRPVPLPGPGDPLSAAGPVFPGSRGQLQIQAEVVVTLPR